MATKRDPDSNVYGRMVWLTADHSYLAVHLPMEAKKVSLKFEKNKPVIDYTIAKAVRKMPMTAQNFPVYPGAEFLGLISQKKYDKGAVAEILDLESPEQATPAAHQELLNFFAKAGLFFENPMKQKPIPSSAEYKQWEAFENSVWDQVAVIFTNAPELGVEKRKQEPNNKQSPEGGSVAEPDPIVEEENIEFPKGPLTEKDLQRGMLVAIEAFDNKLFDQPGVDKLILSLRKHEVTPAEFRQRVLFLFSTCYTEGVKDQAKELEGKIMEAVNNSQQAINNILGIVNTAVAYLETRIKTMNSSRSMIAMAKPDYSREFNAEIEHVQKLIATLQALTPPSKS